MLPDVLRFEPLLVARPWGGHRLAGLGRQTSSASRVGESWEIADLPPDEDGVERRTRLTAGPLAGATPSDLIRMHGPDLLGSVADRADDGFPLLVKLLDAGEDLSVQVHPSAAVASADPGARAKTESWYVLECEPGAVLWFDVRPEVTDAELSDAIGGPDLVPMLNRVPASPGDFHHIPAGRVHALGAGVLVLEVQSPSDTTYRMYDWNLEHGRASRALHVAEARRSVVRGDPAAVSVPASTEPGTRDLVRTPGYWMREHRSDAGRVALDQHRELRVVTVVTGWASVGAEHVTAPDSVVLPASSTVDRSIVTSDDAVIIETGLV
jgi:mannose-6-phosphate isomerase